MKALARAQETWQGMPPRDRRAVMVCGAALLVTAAWMLGWEPAARAIPRIQKELPKDQDQLQQLQALATDAGKLKALPAIQKRNAAELRGEVTKSLETAGITDAVVEVTDTALRVRTDKVSFYTWMQWLDSARKTLGLAVTSMEAKKAGGNEVGVVAASAEMGF